MNNTETGRTILVVDDDELILSLMAEMLKSLGYEALATSDPGQALRWIQDAGDDIDLVLTDVVMPGMRGPELVKRVQAILPSLPCVYVSGYRRDRLDSSPEAGNCRLLTKPFSLESLSRMLDAELSLSETQR